jgi:hypothetical protein
MGLAGGGGGDSLPNDRDKELLGIFSLHENTRRNIDRDRYAQRVAWRLKDVVSNEPPPGKATAKHLHSSLGDQIKQWVGWETSRDTTQVFSEFCI